jgi:hypothetical protein
MPSITENQIRSRADGLPLRDRDINWRDLTPVDEEPIDDLPDRAGGNPLAPVLLNVIRVARDRGVQLRAARAVLVTAIGLLADRDRQLDDERSQKEHLRAQIRACVSGRTIAEERHAIADEREAVDA